MLDGRGGRSGGRTHHARDEILLRTPDASRGRLGVGWLARHCLGFRDDRQHITFVYVNFALTLFLWRSDLPNVKLVLSARTSDVRA